MKLLFRNAKILTSARASVSEGEVHVSDGKIVYVGKPKEFAAERVVDCGGNLLIPGFANAHTHSAMVLFRGLADDLPLQEWLHDRIFPLEEHLTEDDVYWGTMLAAAEYVRGGRTRSFPPFSSPVWRWECGAALPICPAGRRTP